MYACSKKPKVFEVWTPVWVFRVGEHDGDTLGCFDAKWELDAILAHCGKNTYQVRTRKAQV